MAGSLAEEVKLIDEFENRRRDSRPTASASPTVPWSEASRTRRSTICRRRCARTWSRSSTPSSEESRRSSGETTATERGEGGGRRVEPPCSFLMVHARVWRETSRRDGRRVDPGVSLSHVYLASTPMTASSAESVLATRRSHRRSPSLSPRGPSRSSTPVPSSCSDRCATRRRRRARRRRRDRPRRIAYAGRPAGRETACRPGVVNVPRDVFRRGELARIPLAARGTTTARERTGRDRRASSVGTLASWKSNGRHRVFARVRCV